MFWLRLGAKKEQSTIRKTEAPTLMARVGEGQAVCRPAVEVVDSRALAAAGVSAPGMGVP